MNSHFLKTVLLSISLNLFFNPSFCQQKLVIGLIGGSGIPDLTIGYSKPNWTLGGIKLLKPLSLGVYGEYSISKKVKTGVDMTYYRLPLEVSDGLGNVTFLETFTYLNVAPYIAFEPVKYISVAFNLSLRPLLTYSSKLVIPTPTLLTYYGPRLTIKPIKQIGIDIGYENYIRPFATADIGGGVRAFFVNTSVYLNIRFTPFVNR